MRALYRINYTNFISKRNYKIGFLEELEFGVFDRNERRK